MHDALVLAHGAFHGPWCWQPVIDELEKSDLHCVAIDLNRGGLEADRKALQSAVDSLRNEGARVHAIGHSLGCASVAQLDSESLSTATLLAGPVAGPGMPDATACIFPGFLSSLVPQDDGRCFMSREESREAFYHRCDAPLAEWALDRLRPTFVYGAEATPVPIWEALPVTYIACLEDRTVRPDFQQKAAERCPHSVALDSDHSPMLGQPDALAQILLETIARAS